MSFWVYFISVVIGILLFKIYIIRGVRQATASKKGQVGYAVFSLGTLFIGAYVLMSSFSGGIIGLSFSQNFTIALMVAVVVCELIMSIFFCLMMLFYYSNG